MILHIKKILLKFFYDTISLVVASKKGVEESSLSKEAMFLDFTLIRVNEQNYIPQVISDTTGKDDIITEPVIDVGDIQEDTNGPIILPNPLNVDKTFSRKFLEEGWFDFSIPLDLRSLRVVVGDDKGEYYNYTPSAIQYNNVGARSKKFFMNSFFKNLEDAEPIPESEIIDYIAIVKNTSGESYFPQWGFSAIQGIANGEGLQIKIRKPCVMKITGKPNPPITSIEEFDWALSIYGSENPVLNGYIWQYMSNPTLAPIDIKLLFGDHITDLKNDFITAAGTPSKRANIEIIKNRDGQSILPEWDFYAFTHFMPGEAYIVRGNFYEFTTVGNHVYKSLH